MSAEVLADPAARAERALHARARRAALLRATPAVLRALALVLLVLAACGALYGWVRGVDPLVLLACAGALAALARPARRLAPAAGARAQAQATVREVWRALRADADEPRPWPRHAVWAWEGDDGTVGLWRLTRAPDATRAGDGGYVVQARYLASLDGMDTVGAAEATARAAAEAERDEQAALEAHGLARALRQA